MYNSLPDSLKEENPVNFKLQLKNKLLSAAPYEIGDFLGQPGLWD